MFLLKMLGSMVILLKGLNELDPVLFGYEGLGMPVLFTAKGLIQLQRKSEKISHEEEERMEKLGLPEEEIEMKRIITDRKVSMEWLGASANVEILKEELAEGYHTYGLLNNKAFGYRKITYKNIYPGIDIVYSFINNEKPGFEYSIVISPGADAGMLKMRYNGDIKGIKADNSGNLIISTDINGILETCPVSFYGNYSLNKRFRQCKKLHFSITGKDVRFISRRVMIIQRFIIDPFVTSTLNLTDLIMRTRQKGCRF